MTEDLHVDVDGNNLCDYLTFNITVTVTSDLRYRRLSEANKRH